MKKRNHLRWGLQLALLAVLLVCVAALGLIYLQRRALSYNSRPLVLIHAPINHDHVTVGEGIPVHATAREDSGLRRIELWVDDALLAVRESSDSMPKNLTLSYAWKPAAPGTHMIVARAISAQGVPGQSTVTVLASTRSEIGPETHTIQEGETVDVIAANHAVSPERLVESNPDIGSAVAGDELVIPDEDAAALSPPPTGDGSASPSESNASPGSSNPLDVLVLQFFPFLSAPASATSEPTSLRLEVLALETSQAFDGLHCYVGLAGSTPRWFPDADGDQTTDESFPTLGGGAWDAQAALAGEAAPFLSWPTEQNLPADITCVGMADGGADALDLGRIQLSIPPADWDAVTRSAGADGEGGHVEIHYKVTRMTGAPRGEPVWLEPGMTPPTNVRLDDRRISLRWDYTPRADEQPIDGFRVYLNGNLQWTEAADVRESGLPYEWFHPLCGSPYTFGVTAFRAGYPDGPESPAATTMAVTPVGQCNREIQVIFHSLETFELGGDGSPDHLSGDVGPVYGYLYANEEEISFDTRPSGAGGGSLDNPIGLYDNTAYDLNALWTNPDWHFSSMPGTVVDIPPGGSFEFGFYIMDHDRSSDSVACFADSAIIDDNPATGALNDWHEGTLTSADGKCRLAYSFGPAMGSPVGSGVAGGEPLPWLDLEDVTVDEATGAVQVLLRNTGTATWPWKDLDIELRTRAGDTVTMRAWPDFVLEVGQERALDFPAGTASSPFDVCVLLDPANKVMELYERTGALSHGPACQQLPDLTISSVGYDGAGRLRVTVENVGDGTLENRTVELLVSGPSTANGMPLESRHQWTGISLGPREARAFDFDDFARAHDYLGNGYTVQVDPDGALAEQSVDNNSYTVGPGSPYFQLYWSYVQAPYDVRNDVEFTLQAEAVSAEYRRPLLTWHINQDIEWGSCFDPRYCELVFTNHEYEQPHLAVNGDELLQITITAAHAGEHGGNVVGVETFGPDDQWGVGPAGPTRSCSYLGDEPSPAAHRWIMGYADGRPWYVGFHICPSG